MPNTPLMSMQRKKRRKIYSEQLLKRMSYKELRYLDLSRDSLVSSPGHYVKFPDNFHQLPDIERARYLTIQHYPWLHSPALTCRNYSVCVASLGSHPVPVALASMPSSGNTWARAVIEQVTGVFTGSMYQVGGVWVVWIQVVPRTRPWQTRDSMVSCLPGIVDTPWSSRHMASLLAGWGGTLLSDTVQSL